MILFERGDRVEKVGGDYSFEGVVVSEVKKRSGAIRYVVEDDRGLLFIFNSSQIRKCGQSSGSEDSGQPSPAGPDAPEPGNSIDSLWCRICQRWECVCCHPVVNGP